MDTRNPRAAKRLLVVEDNPADAQLTVELLADTEPGGFDVACAATLEEARRQLAEERFDLVLLDLGLPDSVGLETLDAILASAPDLAVVVLSGREDEGIGADAIARGAQDYLAKGVDGYEGGRLLARTLRYALERRQLLSRLAQAELEAGRLRELQALSRLTDAAPSPVTASVYGALPLAELQPDRFAELCGEYCKIVEQAAERQVYRVQRSINAPLRRLAEQLGFLRADPRDLVELHKQSIQQLTQGVGAGTERLLTEEGRYVLLELMGQLAAYYRRFYPGAGSLAPPPSKSAADQ